jgi:hypothetical protein
MPEDCEVIYVTSFWHKKARRRIYAHQCGVKAFPIRVKRKK